MKRALRHCGVASRADQSRRDPRQCVLTNNATTTAQGQTTSTTTTVATITMPRATKYSVPPSPHKTPIKYVVTWRFADLWVDMASTDTAQSTPQRRPTREGQSPTCTPRSTTKLHAILCDAQQTAHLVPRRRTGQSPHSIPRPRCRYA